MSPQARHRGLRIESPFGFVIDIYNISLVPTGEFRVDGCSITYYRVNVKCFRTLFFNLNRTLEHCKWGTLGTVHNYAWPYTCECSNCSRNVLGQNRKRCLESTTYENVLLFRPKKGLSPFWAFFKKLNYNALVRWFLPTPWDNFSKTGTLEHYKKTYKTI
jgi:hypothetical protein